MTMQPKEYFSELKILYNFSQNKYAFLAAYFKSILVNSIMKYSFQSEPIFLLFIS